MSAKHMRAGQFKMKSRGLREKIVYSMVFLLLFMGLMIAFGLQLFLSKVLTKEFRRDGLHHARSIAANSFVDVLTRNTSHLQKWVDNEKKSDPNIGYIFIMTSSGDVLAHTFQNGFPMDLVSANKLLRSSDSKIQLIDTNMGLIYDIAVPILLDKSLLGEVRLGILQESIKKTIMTINVIILAITSMLILLGIILAVRISLLITRPISQLVEGIQSVQRGDFSTQIDIKTKDEIELLGRAFNEMTLRLNHLVKEVTALTKIKERERIALDLHDGCAQEIASFIKRIELCEKLLKIDPSRAFDELETLRENTRNILNKTRQVIFDLKSQEDPWLDLSEKLNFYLKDYERLNNIAIELNISGVLTNIPRDKTMVLFYIINEALNNVSKHSRAENVKVNIEADTDKLKVVIKDDGRGFEIEQEKASGMFCGKYGLVNMQQRASSLGGELVICSAPNQGSEILIEFPLTQKSGSYEI